MRDDPGRTGCARQHDVWWRGKCVYEGFLRVWGLNYAVDPKNPQDVAEALKALHAKDVSIFTDNLQGLDPRAEFVSPHLVTLSFDPYQSPGKQGKQALKILGAKMKELERTAPREKQRGLDPWDVWDMNKVNEKTLSDIATDLLPVLGKPVTLNKNGNTAFGDRFQALIRHDAYCIAKKRTQDHVVWASDKAQEMIEAVGQRRNPDPASLATGMAKLHYYVEHEGMDKHVFALFERACAVGTLGR